jgi:SpoU rRNA methylase family enzyme
LEEHLSSINDNTGEIQVLFDYLNDVEKKVDKLSERLDHLQLNEDLTKEKISIDPLNTIEKKIFLVLYTEENGLTFEEVSEKTNIDLFTVKENVSSLVGKSVPLQRTFCNGQFFFSLNKEFKDLQAKENIVNLSLQSFM